MTARDIEDRVIAIVSEQMAINKVEITRETSLVSDLNADSLDIVELVIEIENNFKRRIPDKDVEKIKTVGQLIDYIVAHQRSKAEARSFDVVCNRFPALKGRETKTIADSGWRAGAVAAEDANMYLLSSKEEIRAALAMMNATARKACMVFATHLLNDPSITNDPDKLGQFCAGSIAVTLEEAGYRPDQFASFMEHHGEAVYNVGLSVLVVATKEAEKDKRWSWLGTAAAVGVGALLGSYFG